MLMHKNVTNSPKYEQMFPGLLANPPTSAQEKIRHMQSLSTEPLPCDHFDMICGTSTGG